MPKTYQKGGDRQEYASWRTLGKEFEATSKAAMEGKDPMKVHEAFERVRYGDPPKPVTDPYSRPNTTDAVDRKRGKIVPIRIVHDRDTQSQKFKSRKV